MIFFALVFFAQSYLMDLAPEPKHETATRNPFLLNQEGELLKKNIEPERKAQVKEDDVVKKEEVAKEDVVYVEQENTKEEEKKEKPQNELRSVKITSERTDYDRKEGVIMFDKNVVVTDPEYNLCSDQLYVFLDGTNELKRIVALGNVAITNEARVGTCQKATYSKASSKIIMYGDGKEKMAHLVDNSKRKSELTGRKITFWLDSEQVEVEGSTVTLDATDLNGKEGSKKIFGK